MTSQEAIYQIACSLLCSHKGLYNIIFTYAAVSSPAPVNTLKCVKLAVLPFKLLHFPFSQE